MATAIPDNVASFTAAEVALATSGALVGDPATAIVGVTTDSRAVRPGNLFVAVRGESFDGHRFIDTAIAAGAAAVLVSSPVGSNSITSVTCDDTLVALGKLAALHRARWEAEGHRAIVAITGSAGKTTTKELCAAALAASLGDEAVLFTRGNLNNRVGLPMTLFGLTAKHRVVVLEMGTSVRGEIAALCAIAEPDVAVLVNVGVAHAEGLAIPGASPEQAVALEKSAILASAGSFAIACADDPWANAALVHARSVAFGFGRAPGARYRLLEVAFAESGRPRLTVERPAGKPTDVDERARISFAVPLLGEVVALDATGALAAADAALEILGEEPVEPALLERTLARRVRAVPGRLALRRRSDGALVLDDTYNASPAAFASSIEVARTLAESGKRRLVIVAGEMRELGAESKRAHDEVGARIAAANPALLVTLGGAADAYPGAHERFSSAAAATVIADRISSGDLVLVKASRGVKAELVVDAILARGGEVTDGPGRGA